MKEVSVCIPAHNEDRTICSTLESIVSQDFFKTSRSEILVCENGSIDNTKEKVQEFSKKHENVRLIISQIKGKSHAWNLLMDNAKYNFRIFADADIFLTKNSLESLYSSLTKDRIIIGATLFPFLKDFNTPKRFFYRLVYPERHQYWLSGQLYAVNASKLKERMHDLGFSKMPNIIADDMWLSAIVGESLYMDRNAVAYYRPPSLKDLRLVERRAIRAKKELEKIFQSNPQNGLFNLIKTKYNEFVNTQGFLNKIGLYTRLPFIMQARYYARKSLDSENYDWETARSTKLPILQNI